MAGRPSPARDVTNQFGWKPEPIQVPIVGLGRCTDESQVPSIVMTASRRVRLGAQRGRAGDRLRGDAVTGARRQQ